ncbi:MAG: hypothetical protein ACRELG_00240, partial [Gemmataceae bacterium]
MLYRCFGAAEDRTAEKQSDPTGVLEFPRHVSPHVPAESAVQLFGYAILPHRLSSVMIRALLEGKEINRKVVELDSPAKTAKQKSSPTRSVSEGRP